MSQRRYNHTFILPLNDNDNSALKIFDEIAEFHPNDFFEEVEKRKLDDTPEGKSLRKFLSRLEKTSFIHDPASIKIFKKYSSFKTPRSEPDIDPYTPPFMLEGICPLCKVNFRKKRINQVYCSKKCKQRSKHFRETGGKPKTNITCAVCGKPLTGKNAGSKTCMGACRTKLWRLRKEFSGFLGGDLGEHLH